MPRELFFLLDLVKRDTPSSLSNLHHQTANASTNTPIHESLCLSPFFTTSIANKSPSAELSSASTMKIASVSSSTASLNNTHSASKIPKLASNTSQTDHSTFNYLHQDSPAMNDKKTLTDNPSTPSIDTSRYCRFLFPDQTSALLLTANVTHQTIQQAICRLFAKRGFVWYRTELFLISSTEQSSTVDAHEALSTLSGKEIRVESRILLRIDFPTKILCVRCDPKRTLLQVLQPIVEKLKLSIGQFVFYANDSLIPLNLNDPVASYDNQRIFTLTKTASGVDMSSRQKTRIINDVFEMISDNDEEIKFDECGILKPVTLCKSTIVVSNDDYPHSPTPETSPTGESDHIYCGPKR